ncbi:sensor histidine kinase [Bifidobacterium adolescentis]|uniref:sensor histidine kinase n=1 Tax=Bifidobacterium adolescentis TaxID=1680 RepID=UPI0016593CBA|nr:histidine kinase [Bifidobacterium adolescentis]MBC8608368.1 sensor histidine kinase [Bifidobacterium faecale]MBX9131886.1 sensor histidine kinase [Bifidobacterium adolescentis]MBX9160845.1 sensor histidine kinase [Bifidobacterium adolescentis]
MSNLKQRLLSWMHGHVFAGDLIITIVVGFLLFGVTGSVTYNPGLLFDLSPSAQMAWEMVMLVPLLIRRWRPQTGALLCVALTLAHLIFGPCLLGADILALFMLYSVIVYGNPKNTKAFIILALTIGLLASALIAWTMTNGPLLTGGKVHTWSSWNSSNPNDTMVTEDIIGSIYTGTSMSEVAGMMAQYMLALTPIEVCIISTIVMSFWHRARMATVRMMRERNEAIAARDQDERDIAALAERARIARDMHDVVAHTLSIIIVQSDGGRYAGTHDPAVARNTMETIRHESERALHDMQRLLGVFGGSPHADYNDIDNLVEQARTVSPDIRIQRSITGTASPEQLGEQASTASYHVVQEALTNIRKYAGPHVDVYIKESWNNGLLTVTVTDNGRGAAASIDGHTPGYGLLGMRERIESAGGSLQAGPRLGGGFEVMATLPYGGKEPATDETGEQYASEQSESCNTTAISSKAKLSDEAITRNIAVSISVRIPNQPSEQTQETTQSAGRNYRSNALQHLRITAPNLRDLLKSLKLESVELANTSNARSSNWVERVSAWTQRHYVLMDAVGALLLVALLNPMSVSLFFDSPRDMQLSRAIATCCVLALAVRRRFPETCALIVFVLSVVQLVFLGSIEVGHIVASLCALYSAVLYGREHAWRWTGLAAVTCSALMGLKIAADQHGYTTLFDAIAASVGLTKPVSATASSGAAFFTGVMYTVAVLMLCAGIMAWARWARSSDSNALVLQAREEALMAEQEKQRILAANMERDRISASIQAEVTATLNSVINQAVDGIRMLDRAEAQGKEPTADEISAAFKAIGEQGRAALKRMRKLLGVLRETGFSDDAHAGSASELQLRPAAPLEEQLQRASR